MLTELHVRDLGVIEDLSLPFADGMTALTGETGAGKTLLVEAFHLLLGGKASPGLVRAGADEALVEGRFFVADPDGGGERELVVSRVIPVSGRSRAWVDGRMVPLSALAELGPSLADIHGQHEHQSLLAPAAQRRALDSFAGSDLAPLSEARRRVRGLAERLELLGGDEHRRERDADVLRHQLAEIGGAGITDEAEEERLAADEERLADMEAHLAAVSQALTVLDPAEDGGPGALPAVARALSVLAGRPAFDGWTDRLRSVLAELGDVASDLRHVADTWERDPERLAAVQERQRLLAGLRRKYGATLGDVLAFESEARKRLDELVDAEVVARRLQAELGEAEAERHRAEEAVRAQREAAAPRLASAVEGRLHGLAMAGARFEVAVGHEGAGDAVTFLLGANPGEPAQPLQQVASGGELARAMLALSLEVVGGPGTMVFDEVDAGVGGEAALALARALQEIAASRQVLVVTHLAQVAAFAHHHVAVHKEARDGRTRTGAAVLGDDRRIVEVSRMLSGHPDSATARAHAVELLARAASAGPGDHAPGPAGRGPRPRSRPASRRRASAPGGPGID